MRLMLAWGNRVRSHLQLTFLSQIHLNHLGTSSRTKFLVCAHIYRVYLKTRYIQYSSTQSYLLVLPSIANTRFKFCHCVFQLISWAVNDNHSWATSNWHFDSANWLKNFHRATLVTILWAVTWNNQKCTRRSAWRNFRHQEGLWTSTHTVHVLPIFCVRTTTRASELYFVFLS